MNLHDSRNNREIAAEKIGMEQILRSRGHFVEIRTNLRKTQTLL
jgi:hypothetical protein